MKIFLAILLLALGALCAKGAHAGTIVIGSTTATRGEILTVPLNFIADFQTTDFEVDVVYDPSRLVPTGLVPAPAGPSQCVAISITSNKYRVILFGISGNPLPNNDICRIRFAVAANAPAGNTALTLSNHFCQNINGDPVTCFITNGVVTVSNVETAPRPGATVALAPGAGGTAGATIAVLNSGSDVTISGCSLSGSPGFTVTTAFPLVVPAGTRALNVQCIAPPAGAAPLLASMNCATNIGGRPNLFYALVCNPPLPASAGNQLVGRTDATDLFGTAVALAQPPSGESFMVVGAPGAGLEGSGRAFVFVRPPGNALGKRAGQARAIATGMDGWVLARELAPGVDESKAVTALGDKFGAAVAISDDGDTIAIASPDAGAGVVNVYSEPLGGWAEDLGSPVKTLTAPAGGGIIAADFGSELSFSADGSLFVGAPTSSVGGLAEAGAAFLFVASGETVTSSGVAITATAPSAGASFGAAVDATGTLLAIGAPNEDQAAQTDAGAAYVYSMTGGIVGSGTRIAPTTTALGDKFGSSVAIVDDMIVAGAPGDDTTAGTDSGSATMFVRSPTGVVTQTSQLLPPAGATQGAGTSISADGSSLVLGAPLATVATRPSQGTAYFYELDEAITSTMLPDATLANASGQANDLYGGDVYVRGSLLVAGVPQDDDELTAAGLQTDRGRVDPYVLDRIFRSGLE